MNVQLRDVSWIDQIWLGELKFFKSINDLNFIRPYQQVDRKIKDSISFSYRLTHRRRNSVTSDFKAMMVQRNEHFGWERTNNVEITIVRKRKFFVNELL